jgi:hypothetical protein
MAWTDESRVIELLDWETKSEDFDRLYEHVIGLVLTRTHRTREQLFAVMSDEELRREVRSAAERFEERFMSLPMFIYMRLRFQALPRAAKQRKDRHDT